MAEEGSWRIELKQEDKYRFRVSFDNPAVPPLITDETEPLGANAGPNPARLLAASVANCLAASLMFALSKFKNDPSPVRASVEVTMVRNEAKRLRIGNMDVDVQFGTKAADTAMLERVLAQFEDFCTVTQSVRSGFPIRVRVLDGEGVLVKE